MLPILLVITLEPDVVVAEAIVTLFVAEVPFVVNVPLLVIMLVPLPVIVPSVLGILIIIFVIYKIIGGGKIVLDYESTNNMPTLPDTICLNVYVENSGSMNGYMCNGSNLKDAVYDYVSDLKKNTTKH